MLWVGVRNPEFIMGIMANESKLVNIDGSPYVTSSIIRVNLTKSGRCLLLRSTPASGHQITTERMCISPLGFICQAICPHCDVDPTMGSSTGNGPFLITHMTAPPHEQGTQYK